MNRQALIVGINTYDTQHLKNLTLPAKDADAIAQLLIDRGNVEVRRIPAFNTPVDSTTPIRVPLTQLEAALVQLLLPEGNTIPDTVLLYFSGYGLCKNQDRPTSFLATSDINPNRGNWGLSLSWLRDLLQQSPVREQIIWLDCYCNDEGFDLTQADPGYRGQGYSRCFIATCQSERDGERGKWGDKEQTLQLNRTDESNHYSQLASILLLGLDSSKHPPGWVTNYTLVELINQLSPPLIFANAGKPILLIRTRETDPETLPALPPSAPERFCPYKGLAYFDYKNEDPQYFYGRETLTDELLEHIRTNNFLAVIGTCGSGKSSLIRAGLLHQLQRGQHLSGTQEWLTLIFQPGEHPLQNLARSFINPHNPERDYQFAQTMKLIQMGAVGLGIVGRTMAEKQRLVLVVDQFEQVFTCCQDETERQQFFDCLLGGLDRTDNQLCLVIGMRTDFLSHCANYPELVQKIQALMVTVTPMTREGLKTAIIKPAQQVGVEIESDLVTQLLLDLEDAASLPLLQFMLTQLWQRRPVDRLMVAEYYRWGRLEGAIEKHANRVYQSLSANEQQIAKDIFFALIQFSENGQVTEQKVDPSELILSFQVKSRNRFKSVETCHGTSLTMSGNTAPCRDVACNVSTTNAVNDFIGDRHSTKAVTAVMQKLIDAGLIVTHSGKWNQTLVTIAHEALIQHWSKLQQWVEEKRHGMRLQRQIEAAAIEWQTQGKPKRMLSELTLTEAEYYRDHLHLSTLGQDLIQQSLQHKGTRRGLARGGLIFAIALLSLTTGMGMSRWYKTAQIAQREHLYKNAATVQNLLPVEPIKGLLLAIETTGQSYAKFQQVDQRITSSLWQAIEVARERDRLDHESGVNAVAFHPDNQILVSGTEDGLVHLWTRQDNLIRQSLPGHKDEVTGVAFSPQGQVIASSSQDGKIRLWTVPGQPLGQPFFGQDWITSIAWSPDGQFLVSGGKDGTVQVWNRQGNPIGQPFMGHQGVVFTVAFSPDGETIASGSGDGTIRVWNRQGQLLGQPFRGHEGVVFDLAFSPDGERIVSGGRDGTVRLWNRQGELIGAPWRGHQGVVFAVAFSPDGETIASGSGDGTIRLWNSQGQLRGKPLRGHQGAVRSLAFSPDGERLASGSQDKTVRLWDVRILPEPQDWQTGLRMACDRLENHPVFERPHPEITLSRDICQAKGSRTRR
ncbi:nSTAND1 domain-containing NTPase [Coleofasciculus sp. E1-EBD-02]|uniref:nSTAND1 domain-containing NTPase n=1 Tax=Coleofasciculus sp. E1-EBD-02 TaxID=3068481 RepID=UPI0032F3335E